MVSYIYLKDMSLRIYKNNSFGRNVIEWTTPEIKGLFISFYLALSTILVLFEL